VLNVALGGSLHLHVPDVFGESVTHRLPPREPVPHAISVDADSKLARIIGAIEIEPMSWHHQAIDRLGKALRVAALAPDGVVEALEHENHPSLIAVQWHPELTAMTDPGQAALFDAFVAAAR
jgi:putative glutamine amidotransferase